MIVNVNKKHLETFGKLKFNYFENHETTEGRVVSRCLNTWDCRCKSVAFYTTKLTLWQKIVSLFRKYRDSTP